MVNMTQRKNCQLSVSQASQAIKGCLSLLGGLVTGSLSRPIPTVRLPAKTMVS